MLKTSFYRSVTTPLLLVGLVSLGSGASVSALAGSKAAAAKASTDESARVQVIITKGSQEIDRRLQTLGSLNSKITAATKLSSSDKAGLSTQISSETSGLTALKTKLTADTSLSDARSDAQSIFSDYRVYALIVPKVELVKAADDQQVTATKLTDLAAKLQSRLDSAKGQGKDVTNLQTKLDDMKTQTSAAVATASAIETKVIDLVPGDYNSDHTILSGDSTQLKASRVQLQTAYSDAKSIVGSLKTL